MQNSLSLKKDKSSRIRTIIKALFVITCLALYSIYIFSKYETNAKFSALNNAKEVNAQNSLSPLITSDDSLLLPTPTPTINSILIKTAHFPAYTLHDSETLGLIPWQGTSSLGPTFVNQLSRTPLGVQQVGWVNSDSQLWFAAVSETGGPSSIQKSTPMITRRGIQGGWSPGIQSNQTCETNYSWSPDGKTLAFVKDQELWVSNAQGEHRAVINLDEKPNKVTSVQFSPNGNLLTIVTSSNEPNHITSDLVLIDTETDEVVQRVKNVGHGALSWTTRGDKLAYLGNIVSSADNRFGTLRLSILTIADQKVVQSEIAPLLNIEPCLRAPEWLNNDSKLLLNMNSKTNSKIADMQGTTISVEDFILALVGRQALTYPPNQGTAPCVTIQASLNGQYLLLSQDNQQIVAFDLIAHDIIHSFPGNLCDANAKIVWKSDSFQYLLWGVNQPLWLIDPLSKSMKTIDDSGLWPSWSPTGRIAYWKKNNERYGLWFLDIQNEKSQRLTDDVWQIPDDAPSSVWFDMTPQWSPNGWSIAFVAQQNDQPEAYLVEHFPQEAIKAKLNCERIGRYYHCQDDELNIEFEYPTRWGLISGSLGGGSCGGYGYSYQFDNQHEAPITGGRSWDFCEPRGGSLTDFRGFVTIDKLGVHPYDPCLESTNDVICEHLSNGVTLLTYLPKAEGFCEGISPQPAPWQSVALDLPTNRKVHGMMFGFNFLSIKAEDELYQSLDGPVVDLTLCQDAVNQLAFSQAAAQLAEEIQNHQVDEETAYKLGQIRRFAESIVIR